MRMTETVWTGWPKRSDKSIYDHDSECIVRSRSKDFDLADAACSLFDGGTLVVLFGIKFRETSGEVWTEKKLRVQESNIRYDLSHDGFQVCFERLKGVGLKCHEEALWKLHIEAA